VIGFSKSNPKKINPNPNHNLLRRLEALRPHLQFVIMLANYNLNYPLALLLLLLLLS
jgi:hypothetical protein